MCHVKVALSDSVVTGLRETAPISMSRSTRMIVESSITATSGFIDGITMATTGEKATTAPMTAKSRGVTCHRSQTINCG